MATFSHLDKILPATIKNEKEDHHVDNHFRPSLTLTDSLDQPLLIVLDEDDGNAGEENIMNTKDDLSRKQEPNRNSPTGRIDRKL